MLSTSGTRTGQTPEMDEKGFVRSTPKSYSTNRSHVVEYIGRIGLSPPAGYHNYPWGWVQTKVI
jgi:hypothetical protein